MKFFTSGFFDQLNPGHVKFLERVAQLGALYVGIGSDENHVLLKNTMPLFSQRDRGQMVSSLRCVAGVTMLDGVGDADFESAIKEICPDRYVASDSDRSIEKSQLCRENNVEYQVLDLTDNGYLSETRGNRYFPYRICLTGGWLDQPWVSGVYPGSVTVLGIEPHCDFMLRGGMATSTRETAKRIWSTFPSGDPKNLAEILFGAENPPGKKYVSGSQDALGICLPGFSSLHYRGEYWPIRIESIVDVETCRWLEKVIWMVPLRERPEDYNPLLEKHLKTETIAKLARSSELAVAAVRERSARDLGKAMRLTLKCWQAMLPLTVPVEFQDVFRDYEKYDGYGLSGCGGGYLIVISDQPVKNAFQIKVRH